MFVINRNGEANSAKCDQSTVRPDRVIWICDATTSNDEATTFNDAATISNDDATTFNEDPIAREREPFTVQVEPVSLDCGRFKRKRLPALLRCDPDNPSGESSIRECELFRPEPDPADSRPQPCAGDREPVNLGLEPAQSVPEPVSSRHDPANRCRDPVSFVSESVEAELDRERSSGKR